MDRAPLDSAVAMTTGSPAYVDDGVVVHWLRYHVVLVTRRQRPFFEDAELAARADALIRQAAEGLGCRVAACAVHPSWVTLEVEAPSRLSPFSVATRVARGVAGALKEESEAVRRSGAAFVHRYLISTESVPEGDCAAFVARVPRR
jgi:REP element-mobilizing transposase RayT